MKHIAAQYYCQLRQEYIDLAQSLKAQCDLPAVQERHLIGRYQLLEDAAWYLAPITADMQDNQVQQIVEALLLRLAQMKGAALIHSIRMRRKEFINEYGEWTAEGRIAQIDELVPELRSQLPSAWTSPNQHGPYFHLFYSRNPLGLFPVEEGRMRWSGPTRTYWYREVVLFSLTEGLPLEHIIEWTTRQTWPVRSKVLWHEPRGELRPATIGDVLVSTLSGTAWIISTDGLREIPPAKNARALAAASSEMLDLKRGGSDAYTTTTSYV